MKALIGIGDSWTQGEGGYPEEMWKANNGRMWKRLQESKDLIPIERQNSWVNQLSQMINHQPINLGQRAIGNRAAVRTLYLNDFKDYSKGTIFFMLSGFDRFDFFSKDWRNDHYQFETFWPSVPEKERNLFYLKHLYSDEASAAETACSILEAQTFAKANNFDFIFANAFELRGKEYFDHMCPSLSEKIDWDRYLHTYVDYKCFAQLLVRKDGLCGDDYDSVANFYPKLPYPAKYMTNDIHPTIEGYKIIAEEIKKIFYSNV